MLRFCLLASVPLLVSAARADVISLAAAADNTLYQDPAGSLSNGSGGYLFAGMTAQNLLRRGLLRFDLTAIPAGSTIRSASLTLHMSRTITGNSTVEVRRVLAGWGEGASVAPGEGGTGAASRAGDATWAHAFFPGTAWANPGGDFASGRSDSQSVGGIGFYTWADLAADAQAWVNAPASNHGWLLRGDESLAGSAKRFDTRENAVEAFRPVLVVDFTPVPGPGGAWVVGAGLLAFSRRKRPVANGLR